MNFHDYTVSPTGKVSSCRLHDSADLAPEAVGVFAKMLEVSQEFRAVVPLPGRARIELDWSSEGQVAGASFYADGRLLSTSLLLAGREHLETQVRAAFQECIQAFCPNLAPEACREWQAVKDRPVIFSVRCPTMDAESMELTADMETCLAAAFFTRMLIAEVYLSDQRWPARGKRKCNADEQAGDFGEDAAF